MSQEHPVVAVDLLGSNKGPEEVAEGICLAKHALGHSVTILPVGPLDLAYAAQGVPVSIDCIADEIALPSDSATTVLRNGATSIAVAAKLVISDRADAMFSCGDTRAAVLWASWPKDRGGIGLIEGVTRAPLALVIPTLEQGSVVILDAGANVDCSPEDLLCFARLGVSFIEAVEHPVEPVRVGLLSNGEESTKGNAMTKAAYKLLCEQIPRFAGNAQPTDAISGRFDVVATDGFPGNIDFKAMEAGGLQLRASLKRHLKMSWRTKLGGWLAKPAFDAARSELDPEEFGSMPLLGTNGLVMIGHGASDRRAVARGIEEAARYVCLGLTEKIASAIREGDREWSAGD